MLMRDMLKTDAFFCFLRKMLKKRMTGEFLLYRKDKDIRGEERLKGQEKKENRKCLHFTFNLFYCYTVLRSSF